MNVFAQSIDKPTFQFTQICANPSYNTFSVSFTFSGTFDPSNTFMLELSDATGSFAGATTVYTSAAGAILTSPGSITFPVPTTTAGASYRLRVKSTAPAFTGQPSTNFSAYYKPHDSQFSINDFVPTANYCSGGNYILKIDNPGTGTNDSPLKYPSLTYNWFRENNGGASAPTLVAAASGGSYTVTQPGVYYVVTNYGACTSDSYSYSNRVKVSEANGNASSSITSSLGNPFCPGSGATILSTPAGLSYQWSKDGIALSGATNQTYSATVGGLYSVKIIYGNCAAEASINLQTESFTASLNVPDRNPIDIQAGETLGVAVTTTATNAVYKWYLNGTVIPDAVSDNYLVTGTGNYKVEVTQTSACTMTKELVFTVTNSNEKFDKIPNVIRLNSSYNVWQIPEKYRNDTTEVMIISSSGEIFKTYNYQNDWPKEMSNFSNINPVYYYIISSGSEVKKGSITVIK